MEDKENFSGYHWRRVLLQEIAKKKLSDQVSLQIVQEVGKAGLGLQEQRALEILKVLENCKTEEEFLKNYRHNDST